MAKVIRYCIKKESHSGPNVFLIHRPYVFSNPFTHIKDKKTKAKYVVSSREEAIEMFDSYFDVMIETSVKFKEEWDKLYEAYREFDEIYLGCYCSPLESCHGDIITEKLKKRAIKEMISTSYKRRQEN